MNDLRFALRQLRKSPGFTTLAVLTLALGIGMNTAIFSLIQDLFLRGLPFSESDRVVRIYGEAKERDLKQLPFSVPKFWHYRDGQNVFSTIAADSGNGFILTGMGEPAQLLGGNVTANYFELVGMHPILGRKFLPQTFQFRPKGAGPDYYAQRRAHYYRGRPAKFADLVVWPGR